ncbi:hypothetical protein QL285_013527 [Trifolium repens]|nr:hypothetical protein QL285_013527 [Trifolium repens]
MDIEHGSSKIFIGEETIHSFSWHEIQWIKNREFVTLASEVLLHLGRTNLLTLQYASFLLFVSLKLGTIKFRNIW